nr:hypothetical protein [Muribaculaceae bacterium]
METPKISTTNSHATMNLTSTSDNSIKNRIEIGTENSPYVKGGYIFEFDKAKGGAYKYTYFTYGISQYPSDIKNFGAEYICNLDTLENIKLAAGEEVKIQDLGIRLYYKTGDQGLFMGKVVVGDKTISYRAADAITAFNPDFDGKNDASIAITDSYGILLGNFGLENLINDLVFCTDSIGNVTVFDDNNISNCGKVGLTVRSVDKLIGLPENSIVTIKKDVYITAQSFVKNNDVTVILDGGNLYRHHKVYALPNKIICKNGAVIDVPSDCQKLHPNNISGASQTHVMDANENCFFGLFGSQNNVAVEFNPMDFVKSEDCKAANSAASINLNNVLERIFTTIYNGNNQMQRMLIKMPETHYGTTNFYMDRPLHIPHNVTIDMSGAFISISYTNLTLPT